jgi:hypothetical protein
MEQRSRVAWIADLSAVLGWMGWLTLWAVSALDPIRRAIALALLVLGPLGLASRTHRAGTVLVRCGTVQL